MSLQAKFLKLRLFLEGTEIPCISATVQMYLNAASTAAIQIVPLDSIEQFKQKTLIHLFYYNFLDERDVDPNDFSRYNLLFCGEVIAYNYVKGALGRSAVLQCADLTNNWNRAFQYQITYGPNGNFLTPAAANYAAGTNKFNNIVDGHATVLGSWLRRSPKTPGLENLKGLLGGIITIIEQFGGVVGHSRGVLDYFTVAELKNKTIQQVTTEDNDETAQKLFDAKEFYEWLENGLTQLGELCSLWDMIRMLFSYIYHEYAPICSPAYSPGTSADLFEDTNKINKALEEVIDSLYDSLNTGELKTRVFNSINKLRLIQEYPFVSKEQKTNMDKAINDLSTLYGAIERTSKFTKLLSSAKKNVENSRVKVDARKYGVTLEKLHSIIFKPECYFVSAPRCNVIFPEQNTQFSYSRNYEQEYTRLRLQSGMLFDIDKEQLFADFSYAPSGKEIRFIGQQEGVGNKLSAVLPWEKFTGVMPKFEYIQDINYVASRQQKQLQKNVKTTQQSSTSDLQKTIQNLAKSYKQKAANFNFYKYRFMSRQIGGSCRFNPMLVVGFPLVVIDEPFIVNREKLIDLVQQRGTKLDSVTDQDIVDNIKDFASLLKAPNQFIGYPTTITHLVGQDGGTTSFNCTHARPHRITGDDFLQIYTGQVKEGMGTVTSKTLLDADTLLKNQDLTKLKFLVSLTPQEPPQKTDTTPELSRPKLKLSGFDVVVPNFRTTTKTEEGSYVGPTRDADILGGSIKVPTKYGTRQLGSNGLNNGTITAVRVVNDLIKKINIQGKDQYVWTSLLVYEDVKNQLIAKPLPLEEILRPSWFSPNYSNLKIGEQIYQKFFKCGSIVDELVFQSQKGLSIQTKANNRFEILDQFTESKDLISDTTNLIQKSLADPVSMESAIDILAFQYGELIREGGDVNQFINDYTSRPIATMENVLGTADLEFVPVGNDIKVTNGKLGFHSIAVSGLKDLIGLVKDPSLPLPSRKGLTILPPAVDPRYERKQQIKKYVEELNLDDGEIIGLIG
jgi:hypothetical protein